MSTMVVLGVKIRYCSFLVYSFGFSRTNLPLLEWGVFGVDSIDYSLLAGYVFKLLIEASCGAKA